MKVLYATLDDQQVSGKIATAASPRLQNPVPPGVYESVLVRSGVPALATAHAQRHVAGCQSLGLEAPATLRLLRDMHEASARCADRGRLRLLRWRDPDEIERSLLTLTEEPARQRERVVTVAPHRRTDLGLDPDRDDSYRHKRLDHVELDRMRSAASAGGRLDFLILDERGVVLEGAKTNVFWRVDRTLFTPAATLPILPGIRRAWLLRAASRAGLETREVEATIDEVRSADEVIVTNAILGVVRRVTVEG